MQSLTNVKSLTASGVFYEYRILESDMATMTIRNLDDQLKMRLRIQAAQHGRSMEDEARDILRAALSQESVRPVCLVGAIRARIAPLGGIELALPEREPMREPIGFDA